MSFKPELCLNGFALELSTEQIQAQVCSMPDNSAVSELRDLHRREWFLHWHLGELFALPRSKTPRHRFAEFRPLRCEDQLWLLKARIADELPEVFAKRPLLRFRPFKFRGNLGEIVSEIAKEGNFPAARLKGFEIYPAYELDVKIIAFEEGKPLLGLFVRPSTKWTISTPLRELLDAGVDLRGLFVVRRERRKGERALVGRVERLNGNTVQLSESYSTATAEDADAQIAAESVQLEGTKASFSFCLRHLLGQDYRRFEELRDDHMGRILGGAAVRTLLDQMQEFFRKRPPLQLTPELAVTVGRRLALREVVPPPAMSKVVHRFPPVEFCFEPSRTKRHQYPWFGLSKYGPFSRSSFANRSPVILLVCPEQFQGPSEQFFRLFTNGVTGVRDSRYPSGFAKTFGLADVRAQTIRVQTGTSGDIVANYRRAIQNHLARGEDPPQAALVVVPEEFSKVPDERNPYLHTKALLLTQGIPSQQLRSTTVVQSSKSASMQSALQNISVAMYAKLGGTPWTVDHDETINDEVIIGMGYTELSGSRFESRQRFVGVATVFQRDGSYLLGQTTSECPYEEYPTHLRQVTREVLDEVSQRNGWRGGDRIRLIFHTYKELKRDEMAKIAADCAEALRGAYDVEFAFLTVTQDHPFSALDFAQNGLPHYSGALKGVYAPDRGCAIRIGENTMLLNVCGAPLVKRPQLPLPEPVLVHLHPQSTFKDLNYLTEQVLKFTGLSWRSTLPARKPVTIYYSELITEFLARCRCVLDWSPAMLNTRLRSSRWFL